MKFGKLFDFPKLRILCVKVRGVSKTRLEVKNENSG